MLIALLPRVRRKRYGAEWVEMIVSWSYKVGRLRKNKSLRVNRVLKSTYIFHDRLLKVLNADHYEEAQSRNGSDSIRNTLNRHGRVNNQRIDVASQ